MIAALQLVVPTGLYSNGVDASEQHNTLSTPYADSRWRASRPVVVRNAADSEQFAAQLEAFTGRPVVSRFSFPVYVSGFNGELHQVPLSEIGDRLLADDPRRDPFMDAARQLFEAQWNNQEAHLVYVLLNGEEPTSAEIGEALEYAARETQGATHDDFYLLYAKDASTGDLFRFGPVLILPAMLFLQRRDRWMFLRITVLGIATVIPFIALLPFILFYRVVELFAVMLFVHVLRTFRTQHLHARPVLFRMLPAAVAVFWLISAIGSAFTAFHYGHSIAFLLTVSGSVFSAYVIWNRMVRPQTTDHRLFIAVPMVRERPSVRPLLSASFLLVLGVSAGLLAGSADTPVFRVPVPVRFMSESAVENDPVLRSIAEFTVRPEGAYYPSLGSYVAHRHFQTSVSHVRDLSQLEFVVPEPGSSIARPRFERVPNGGFRGWTEDAFVFDDHWFDATFDHSSSLAVRLFLSEPGPMIVDQRPVQPGGFVTRSLELPILPAAGLAFLSLVFFVGRYLHIRRLPGVDKVRTVAATSLPGRAA